MKILYPIVMTNMDQCTIDLVYLTLSGCIKIIVREPWLPSYIQLPLDAYIYFAPVHSIQLHNFLLTDSKKHKRNAEIGVTTNKITA